MSRESAIKHGKAQTGNVCVFTGLAGADGMHLYPAGDFVTLADIPENIFAGVRDHHHMRGVPCFDFKQVDGVDIVRPVSERRWMLENMTLDEFRPAIRKKINVVGVWCDKFGIEFPDAVQPTDFYELRLRGREC